jgi:hypothetical protein
MFARAATLTGFWSGIGARAERSAGAGKQMPNARADDREPIGAVASADLAGRAFEGAHATELGDVSIRRSCVDCPQ